jgi:hypothetical protein
LRELGLDGLYEVADGELSHGAIPPGLVISRYRRGGRWASAPAPPLSRHRKSAFVHLVGVLKEAPDPDAEVLALFRHRFSVEEGRRLLEARVLGPDEDGVGLGSDAQSPSVPLPAAER